MKRSCYSPKLKAALLELRRLRHKSRRGDHWRRDFAASSSAFRKP